MPCAERLKLYLDSFISAILPTQMAQPAKAGVAKLQGLPANALAHGSQFPNEELTFPVTGRITGLVVVSKKRVRFKFGGI